MPKKVHRELNSSQFGSNGAKWRMTARKLLRRVQKCLKTVVSMLDYGSEKEKGKDLMATAACAACEIRERVMDPAHQKNRGNKQ